MVAADGDVAVVAVAVAVVVVDGPGVAAVAVDVEPLKWRCCEVPGLLLAGKLRTSVSRISCE